MSIITAVNFTNQVIGDANHPLLSERDGNIMTELETKLTRIDSLLRARGLEALLLQKVSSFAGATCGATSYVNTAATDGAASLLITPNGR
jgi:hypothetical protein